MGRYGKVRETDLMKNQKRFYETLDTTTPIDKYFKRIYDWIQHKDNCKQTYTAYQIMNKDYTTVLSAGLYTEPGNMWRKKTSSDKTWAELKKIFAEEYHNLR